MEEIINKAIEHLHSLGIEPSAINLDDISYYTFKKELLSKITHITLNTVSIEEELYPVFFYRGVQIFNITFISLLAVAGSTISSDFISRDGIDIQYGRIFNLNTLQELTEADFVQV